MPKKQLNDEQKPINILYIIDKLDYGGAQEFLLNLIPNLDRERYVPHVCSLHKSLVKFEEFYQLGVAIYNLDVSKGNPLSIVKIFRLIKRHKINIVHTFLFASNTYGRIGAILARTPAIISHEVANDQEWENPVHLLVDRILARSTDFVIANAEAVKNFYVQEAKIPQHKTIKINTSIQSESYEKQVNIAVERKKLGLLPDKPVVGFVGRLRAQKRPHDFIQAAQIVLQSLPEIQFAIVGDGELRQMLEKEVARDNLAKNVYFLGYRRDLPTLMKCLDVLVNTSSWEGLPMTIMEAMLAKKPVVATNVDGNAEIVTDGCTGLLTPFGNTEEIAKAIVTLLRDPQKSKDFGERGYKRMKKDFNIVKIAQKIEELYRRALDT